MNLTLVSNNEESLSAGDCLVAYNIQASGFTLCNDPWLRTHTHSLQLKHVQIACKIPYISCLNFKTQAERSSVVAVKSDRLYTLSATENKLRTNMHTDHLLLLGQWYIPFKAE